MEVEEALLEFLSPSGATGLHIRNNLPSEEPRPSTSAASAHVGYFASLSIDDEEELIPMRPVSPASIAAASPLPSPSPSVSSSPSWADSGPRTPESGLGEELQLLPQLLRVNEQIRDEMVKLVKVSQDSARALEATTMAVQEMVQQQQEIMANMAMQGDKY